MSAAPPWWPWAALVGLGCFHGVNPAMGWLFAVALGLHRQSRKAVALSWFPIALGHAGAVALTVSAALAFGLVLDHARLSRAAATVLIGWAAWHAIRGHHRPLRIGMRTGLAGLALWSFLMSSAHGAGLMLIPVVLPLCLAASPSGRLTAAGSLPLALAALGVHTAAMLATMTVISVLVYDRVGLAFLRSGWVNLDLIWVVALAVCGAILLLA
ncbi:MAG: hypothetical protein JO081_06245 [Alphaproteobacteria bacterium]|nr:hypothetical protein [Alphaproteobacteria bacterium]